MEDLKNKQTTYQKIVQKLLSERAQSKPAYGEIDVETIFDSQQHRYQIVHLGWHHKRWLHQCVMHLDLRGGKIWILRNSTEHDLAAELVNLGVPRQDIVLGFCPPALRELSDYAVG